MKFEITDFSLQSIRPSIADIHATLNLWNDADSTLSSPAKTERLTVNSVKTFVEGVSAEELAARWNVAMKKTIQTKITSYATEQAHINNVFDVWEAQFNNIDKEIQG